MRIYFYDITPVRDFYQKWEQKQYPGHLLYGLPLFKKYGIESVLHHVPFNPYCKRVRLSIHSFIKILFCEEKTDVIYAVTHRGLELLILLRALRLYNKTIIIWHHTAITNSSNPLKDFFSRLFYKGIDRCYFFSQELIDRSLKTKKISTDKARLIHWGADLDFYDSYLTKQKNDIFVSTGRERRNFITLLKAVSQTSVRCEILAPNYGLENIQEELNSIVPKLPENIKFQFVNVPINEITKKVADAYAVLICCQDYPYTVGLTTLVEALALGKPVITTDNPTFAIDVEKEKVGLKVPYYDVSSWVESIIYLVNHQEEAEKMGKRGRLLAENQFNLEYMSEEIATDWLNMVNKNREVL